jgi:hypothetical protein
MVTPVYALAREFMRRSCQEIHGTGVLDGAGGSVGPIGVKDSLGLGVGLGKGPWTRMPCLGLKVPEAEHRGRIADQTRTGMASQDLGGGGLDGDARPEAQGRLHGEVRVQAGPEAILGGRKILETGRWGHRGGKI